MAAALPTVGLVAGPTYAGLIFGLAAIGVIVQRRLPRIDPAFGLLAVAFAALCWASIAWSIDPARSRAAALQMTVILFGCLMFLAAPRLSGDAVDRLFRVLFVATLVGAGVSLADRAFGYPLLALTSGGSTAALGTKYNRGIDHLVLIAWPQFAYWCGRRRWPPLGLLVAAVVVTELAGLSLAGKVGIAAGAVTLVVACWVPRLVTLVVAGGTAIYVATLPFALRLLTEQRMALASYLKGSGLHRLEIWDLMTQRVLQRPVLGWGFGVGGSLPISAEELSHYVVQRDQGIYPHNQWLGLWVETGAVGAALGLCFALLVVLRMRRLTRHTLPFACALLVSALAIASVNFEVKTDSWWAAILAGSWLLIAVDSHRRDFAIPMTNS